MHKTYIPVPIFDTLSDTIDFYKSIYDADNHRDQIKKYLHFCFSFSPIMPPEFATKDYEIVLKFLYSYRGSEQTFNAYRRDIERLIQWSWFVKETSIVDLQREDIEAFVEFCIKPPKKWIGFKKVAKFKLKEGLKVPNNEWKPFEASLHKKDFKDGKKPNKEDYQLSQKALKV